MSKFVAVNTNTQQRTDGNYKTVKGLIRFGMRKPHVEAGPFDVLRVEDDGTETFVMNAYKRV